MSAVAAFGRHSLRALARAAIDDALDELHSKPRRHLYDFSMPPIRPRARVAPTPPALERDVGDARRAAYSGALCEPISDAGRRILAAARELACSLEAARG